MKLFDATFHTLTFMFRLTVALFTVALALIALNTVSAQPGCVGLSYQCSDHPCCNPFVCSNYCGGLPTPCCSIRSLNSTTEEYQGSKMMDAFKAIETAKKAELPLLEAAKRESDLLKLKTGVQCEGTANACTSDSDCCSGSCQCKLIISNVCCA